MNGTDAHASALARRRRRLLQGILMAAFLLVLGLPFVLRAKPPHAMQGEQGSDATDLPVRRLVIVSPHEEGIRHEFERAFSDYTARNFGHQTDISWQDQGGTSSSIRWVRSRFESSPGGIGVDMFYGGGIDP